jgi:hypothetical protein
MLSDQSTIETDGGFVRVTGVEARVCREIANRQAKGIAKYGTTLSDNPAHILERLQHLKEELLDGALYTQWAIERLAEVADDGK